MNRAYFNALKVVEQVKEDTAYIIEVDTTLAGVSNSDQFQFTGAEGEYDVLAFQSGVQVASFNNLVDEQTITLPTGGLYELRVIPRGIGFNKVRFDNSGDRLKLLKTLQWGDYGVNEPNQIGASWGCNNHSEIAGDGKWFAVVTDGERVFSENSLTSLPSDMTLLNLTDGLRMFENNSLSSLPSNMSLPNLAVGSSMFFGNSLTSLPSDMTLLNLTSGASMFRSNNLASLPSGMTLQSLTNGASMFNSNNLASLPSGMTLQSLTNGRRMFENNSLTSLPSGMTLPSLTNGARMFQDNTINTARYSQLLIDLEANNPNNNVEFHGGNSKYNAAGEIARNALTARGWDITDGGLE